MNLYIADNKTCYEAPIWKVLTNPEEVFIIAETREEANILVDAFVTGALEPHFHYYKGLEIYGLKQ